MAEIWAMAAVTVVGGVMAGKAAEKKSKADQKFQEGMTKEESKLAAQRSGYDMALEDFYNQKNRFEKQRGLDQFRQFSTMGTFAPGAQDTSGRIAAPVMPKYSEFSEDEEIDPATGKKKKSLIDKRVDLHTKPLSALKKLF